jgi:YVTN family beta-propeller protein
MPLSHFRVAIVVLALIIANNTLAQTTTPKVTEKNDSVSKTLVLQKTIYGQISPKSIVHSGDGLFFAQNMMYNHTVTVYDRNYKLLKTIKDEVNLADYGFDDYNNTYKGAPVEVAFSHEGQYAWVSNYLMNGKGFDNAGEDDCGKSDCYDPSFLYKVNTQTYQIEQVIKVGAVPKYVAVSPNNKYVLVTNWCSGDVSIVDVAQSKEILRIDLGPHPRGIVIDNKSEHAYIAIMGGTRIADLNLNTLKLSWLTKVGLTPRHLVIDPINNRYLYATLNNEGNVVKVDLTTNKVVKKCYSGKAPRSMAISDDGSYLYVVNYLSNTISKIRTADMKVIEKQKTNHHPIGITYDSQQNTVWVACYSGCIMVFEDTEPLNAPKPALAANNANLATVPSAQSVVSANNKPALSGVAATKSYLSPTPSPKNAAKSTPKNKAYKVDTRPQCTETESYHIVVASFDKETLAQKTAKDLRSKGVDATVIAADAQRYRVVYGCYATETAAKLDLPAAKEKVNKGAWVWKEE